MKLIVGLGNPGSGYSKNRHNVGFACLRHLAHKHGISFNKKQSEARTGSGKIEGETVTLARPQTFMNLSGQSVSRLLKKLKLSLSTTTSTCHWVEYASARVVAQAGTMGLNR